MRYLLLYLCLILGSASGGRIFAAEIQAYQVQTHSAQNLGEARAMLSRMRQNPCADSLQTGLSSVIKDNPSATWIAFNAVGYRSAVTRLKVRGSPGEKIALVSVLPLVELSALCQGDEFLGSFDMRDEQVDLARRHTPEFSLTLPESGELNLQYFVYSTAGLIYPFQVIPDASFQVLRSYQSPLYFLMNGGLIAICFYNFFLWVGARKRLYKWNVLYIGSALCLTLILGDGFALIINLFDGGTLGPIVLNLTNSLDCTAAFVATAFASEFLRHFLAVNESRPRLLRTFRAVIWTGYIWAIVSFVACVVFQEIPYFNPMSRVYSTVGFIFNFLVSLYFYWKSRNRMILIYVGGLLGLAVGVSIFTQFLDNNLQTSLLTKNALLFGGFLEAMVLSVTVGYATRLDEEAAKASVVAYNAKLLTMNDELEELVDQKTHEIRLILSFIDQALFVLEPKGRTIAVGEERSKHSEELLPILRNSDLGFRDLLSSLDLSDDQAASVYAIVEASLTESRLSFDLNEASLPRTAHRKSDGRPLELSWIPILSSDDRVHRVLVSIRDLSLRQEREKLEEGLRLQDAMILELLQPGLVKSRRCLAAIRGGLEQAARTPIRILREIHTAKGLSRTFGLRSLSSTIHRLESEVASHRLSPEQARIAVLSELKLYEEVLNQKLKLGEVETKKQSEQSLASWLARQILVLNGMENSSGMPLEAIQEKLLAGLSEARRGRFLSDLFADFEAESARIAERLGKEAPLLVFSNDRPLQLSEREEEVLLCAMTHIVRNAVDHGIESERERRAITKPGRGRIHLELVSDSSEKAKHRIRIWDDGRGVDLNILRQRLKESGIVAEDLYDELENLFRFGFSTRTEDSLTEISGRGVGLDAAREALRALGGDLCIEVLDDSEHGGLVPIAFVLQIPIQKYCASP